MDEELSAADHRRATGGMRRRKRRRKWKARERASSGWLIPSGCLSDVMPTHSAYLQEAQTAARPPCLPDISRAHEDLNKLFNLVQRIKNSLLSQHTRLPPLRFQGYVMILIPAKKAGLLRSLFSAAHCPKLAAILFGKDTVLVVTSNESRVLFISTAAAAAEDTAGSSSGFVGEI